MFTALLSLAFSTLMVGLIIKVSNYRVPAARYKQPSAQERLEAMAEPRDPALTLAVQEHEVFDPMFLETQAIMFNGLGHPASCPECDPPSLSFITTNEMREMDPDEVCDLHGHQYVLSSYDCVVCGEWDHEREDRDHEDKELFPGWGI